MTCDYCMYEATTIWRCRVCAYLKRLLKNPILHKKIIYFWVSMCIRWIYNNGSTRIHYIHFELWSTHPYRDNSKILYKCKPVFPFINTVECTVYVCIYVVFTRVLHIPQPIRTVIFTLSFSISIN